MNKTLLMLAAAVLFLAGVGTIWLANQYWQEPVSVTALSSQKMKLPSGWIDAFELTERSGKQLGTADLKGKVWAASFFFADCPGECRQQNLSIGQFQREFGPQGVTFVSITVNPERDTPDRLRKYADDYTKSTNEWLFLTGDLTYIRRIGAEFFRVAVDKETHGSRLMLVDKWGNIRDKLSTNAAAFPEEYAKIRPLLRELLTETEPPAEFKAKAAAETNADKTETAEAAIVPTEEQP